GEGLDLERRFGEDDGLVELAQLASVEEAARGVEHFVALVVLTIEEKTVAPVHRFAEFTSERIAELDPTTRQPVGVVDARTERPTEGVRIGHDAVADAEFGQRPIQQGLTVSEAGGRMPVMIALALLVIVPVMVAVVVAMMMAAMLVVLIVTANEVMMVVIAILVITVVIVLSAAAH